MSKMFRVYKFYNFKLRNVMFLVYMVVVNVVQLVDSLITILSLGIIGSYLNTAVRKWFLEYEIKRLSKDGKRKHE